MVNFLERPSLASTDLIVHPHFSEILLDPTTIRNIDSAADDAPCRSGMRVVSNDHLPDPTVFESPVDAPFAAVATNHMFEDNRLVKIQAARSYDGVEWELQQEDALEQPAEWSKPFVIDSYYDNGDIAVAWAPYVWTDEKTGLFKKYYATPIKKVDRYFWWGIGVAVSEHPTRGYKDRTKEPLVYGLGTECIDPFVRRNNDGQVELFFGSDGHPIQKVLLTDDGLSRAYPDEQPEVHTEPIPFHFYMRVPEGAFVDDHNGEEVTFVSGADCYGNGFPYIDENGETRYYGEYAVLAVRRDPATGDNHWKIILEGNRELKNPGNVSILHPDASKPDEILIYGHAIDRSDRYLPGRKLNKRKMFVAKARYNEEGWPEVVAA